MALRSLSLDDITIEDEGAFAHVALYQRLKHALRTSRHRFLVPAEGTRASWDRALFLNLTFWNSEQGADVLCEGSLAADVVAHAAWHHLASAALARAAGSGRPSAAAFFCGESIASAFDLYLVGRLLDNAPDSDFITTQVPILHEVANEAGLSDASFAALLADIVREPERAFEDLRVLLFEVAMALVECPDVCQAEETLQRFTGHRFEPLLHHYQLSNWILHARAHATPSAPYDAAVAALHSALQAAPVSLDWLVAHWLPRLDHRYQPKGIDVDQAAVGDLQRRDHGQREK